MGVPEDIELFERSLQDLIVKYEQYFLGLEKRAPLKLLEMTEKLSRKYVGTHIPNTMLKFKVNALNLRFHSYRQYWERINRLIEEGKYSRERFKMALHEKEKVATKADQPPPRSELEQLYTEYLDARKACNLPVDNVSLDVIASTIEKSRPAIMDKYRCNAVEFRVVIENGAPKIKARPKG